MTANPWSKFYWNDWENDPALKLCSLAAQGLWMRCLCICAKADPKGYLLVAGQPLTPADLASLVGKPEREVETHLSDLLAKGVCSRDRKGRIYSRRMLRDVQKQKKATQNGSLGGNPILCKQTENVDSVNTPDKPPDNTHKPEAIYQKEVDPNGSIVSTNGADPPERVPIQTAFDNYNIAAEELGLPLAEKLTNERRTKLRARLREHTLDGWNRALEQIEGSDFLRGQNDKGWRASLDFLLRPSSLNKVIEGQYANERTEH